MRNNYWAVARVGYATSQSGVLFVFSRFMSRLSRIVEFTLHDLQSCTSREVFTCHMRGSS